MVDKTVKIHLDFDTNDQKAKVAAKDIEDINKAKHQAETTSKQATQAVEKSQQALTNYLRASVVMAGVGAGILAAAKGASNEYLRSVGLTETASRKWLGINQDIHQSYVKIGRVATEQMTPFLKAYSTFMSGFATFAEKNPMIIQGAIGAGGVLVAVGTIGTVLNGLKVLRAGMGGASLLGTAKSLVTGSNLLSTGEDAVTLARLSSVGAGTGGKVATTAAAGGGLSVLGVIGSVLGGLFVGGTVANAAAKTDFGKKMGFANVGEGVTAGAYGLAKLFTGSDEAALSVGKFVAQLLNVDGAATAAASALAVDTETLKNYIQFLRQQGYAQQDHNIQMGRAQRDFNIQQSQAAQDFQIQTGRAARDFHISQTQATQDFYRSQFVAQRDYQIQQSRANQDFNISQSRAKQDHEWRLRQIMLSGDGYAFWEEQRQFGISQQRAKEDFSLSRSRAQQDFQIQQSDAAYNFNISRQRAQLQFQIQQADAAQDFAIQRKRAILQFQISMSDAEQDFQRQRNRQILAWEESLKTDQYYSNLEIQIKAGAWVTYLNWLNKAISSANASNPFSNTPATGSLGGSLGIRDVGGYVSRGMWQMHDDEFVLKRDSTRLLESIAGGRLTQERVLALAAGQGSRRMVYNDHRVFQRAMTADEKEFVRRENRHALEEMFR